MSNPFINCIFFPFLQMLLARIMSYHVITMEIGNASRIIIVLPLSTVWRNTRPLLQCQLSFQLVRQLPGAGHSGHRTLIVSVELIKDDKRCANCRASDCVSRCRAACGALSYSERYHLYLCVYPLHTVYLCSVSVCVGTCLISTLTLGLALL